MKLILSLVSVLTLTAGVAFGGATEDKAWQADCVAAEKGDAGANDASKVAGLTNVAAFCKCIDAKTADDEAAYPTFKKGPKYSALEDTCAKEVGWTAGN